MRIVNMGFERALTTEGGVSCNGWPGGGNVPYIVYRNLAYGTSDFLSYCLIRSSTGSYIQVDFPQRDEVYARIRFNLYYGYWDYPFRAGFKVIQSPLLEHAPYGDNWQMFWCGGICAGYFFRPWDSWWNTGSLQPGLYRGPGEHPSLLLSMSTPTGYIDGRPMILEFHILVNSVNGVFEVRLDGNVIGEYYGNTDPMGVGYVDQLMFYVDDGNWDDIAVNDVLGTRDRAWPGNGTLITVDPTSDGLYTDFTGAGYTAVTRAGSGVNTCDAEGEKETYTLGTVTLIPGGGDWEIKSVVPMLNARRQYGESVVKARQLFRVGTTNFFGLEQDIPYAYGWVEYGNTEYVNPYTGAFETNPVTDLPWSVSDLSGSQVGVEFTLLASTTTTTTEE